MNSKSVMAASFWLSFGLLCCVPGLGFGQNAISTGTNAGFRMYRAGQNDWWLDPSHGNFDIRVNGLPAAVTLNASGNLGIGTTSPAQKLQVYGTAGNVLSSVQNTNASGYSALQLFSDADQSYLLYGGSAYTGYAGAKSLDIIGGGGPIAFFNTAAEAMRITSTGYVGIGTTGPAYPLDVNGDVRSSGIFRGNGSGLTNLPASPPPAEMAVSTMDATSATPYGGINITSNVFISAGELVLGANFPVLAGGFGDRLAVQGTVDIHDTVNANNWQLQIANANNSFNQAIVRAEYTGTNGDANYKLLSGVGTAGTKENFYVRGDGQGYFAGNVGIGTASPFYPLVVQNSGGGTAHNSNIVSRFQANGSGQNATIQFSDNVTYADFISMLGGDLLFTTSNPGAVSALMIKGGGNVGIGTTAPGQKLEIFNGAVLEHTNNGARPSYQITYDNLGTSYILGIQNDGRFNIASYQPTDNFDNNTGIGINMLANGNVGIGTTAPGQKLSVAGTVESTSGGFKFPDGTVQLSAASLSGSAQTVTAAASVTFSGLSAGTYRLIIDVTQNASAGHLLLQFNGDSGPHYSEGEFVIQDTGGTGTTGDLLGTRGNIPLTFRSTSGILAGESALFDVVFGSNPSLSSKVNVSYNGAYEDANTGNYTVLGFGRYVGASALNSATVSTSAGTFTGTLTLQKIQ